VRENPWLQLQGRQQVLINRDCGASYSMFAMPHSDQVPQHSETTRWRPRSRWAVGFSQHGERLFHLIAPTATNSVSRGLCSQFSANRSVSCSDYPLHLGDTWEAIMQFRTTGLWLLAAIALPASRTDNSIGCTTMLQRGSDRNVDSGDCARDCIAKHSLVSLGLRLGARYQLR
jgi:hypothetical protein